MTETRQITESSDKITKDMTIGDVVQKYPQVTETLLANGVHCVGCGARFFETLEMGFKGHGMSDAQVESVISQLNDAVKNAPEGPLIEVTEKAAAQLKELMKAEGKDGHALRVQVVAGGCGGNSYGLDFDEKPQDGDTVVEMHGLKLLVASHFVPLVRGAKIDYVEGENAGFRISNQRSKGGCGCS
jgi:iron-sulfur cluster assembly protein